jgi:hypothetical protein
MEKQNYLHIKQYRMQPQFRIPLSLINNTPPQLKFPTNSYGSHIRPKSQKT